LDLIERVLGDIMRSDIQMVFLGKGEQRFSDLLNWANCGIRAACTRASSWTKDSRTASTRDRTCF
jgi:hypothetical protein